MKRRARKSMKCVSLLLTLLSTMILPGRLPATAGPAALVEEGAYQEDFTSYTYKDWTGRTEWDVWMPALRLARPDGVGQDWPAIAVDAEGGIVVVWPDARNDYWDLYATRLDGGGNRLWRSDVQVNAISGMVEETAAGIAADSDGNVMVVWEDRRNGHSDIYAQKLDKNGNKLWGPDRLVNSGEGTGNQVDPAIGVDGHDNAVIVWADDLDGSVCGQKLDPMGNRVWVDDDVRISSAGWLPAVAVSEDGGAAVSWVTDRDGSLDVYAQRLDATGTRQWLDEVRVNSDDGLQEQNQPTMALDSSGNAIVVWSDDRNDVPDLYAQRLGEDGDKLWSGDVRVSADSGTREQTCPSVAVDGDDNAIVVWVDRRSGMARDIYSQKLDQDGNQVWAGDVKVNSGPDTSWQDSPAVVADGNSKLMVAWADGRNADSDIYLQMLGGNGSRLWAIDVQANARSGKADQMSPAVTVDPTNNAFVVWGDTRYANFYIYAQKLDGNGSALWPTDVRVNSDLVAQRQEFPDVAMDGQENFAVVWQDWRNDDRDIYAQKLDGNGNRLWTTEVRVNSDAGEAAQRRPAVAGDAAGNVVVAWLDERDGTRDVYAQKLSADGHRLWEGDVRVSSAGVESTSVAVAIDAAGNAIITWADSRVDSGDIYAQKLNGSGNWMWVPEVRVNSDVGSAWQFNPAVAVSSSGGAVIAWDDYRNKIYGTYAQKLDQSGNKMWVADVKVATHEAVVNQTAAAIAMDENDYATIVWHDARTGDEDVYMQRLNGDGDKLWIEDVQVNSDSGTASQREPDVAVDRNGNARIVWNDQRNNTLDVYAQKMNTIGGRTWLADLQVVYPDLFYLPSGSAQSRTVDSVPGDIIKAGLTTDYQANGGSVRFSVTNDGGAHWAEVTPGITHVFTTTGSDLRWQAVLAADPVWNRSPIIHSLRVEYSTDLPGADGYEADDACDMAQPIQVNGAAQAHSFHQQSDADWAWFEATAGTTYLIQTANTGPNADTVLELYNTCAQLPFDFEDNAFGSGSLLTFQAPTSGIYYVNVHQHDPFVRGEGTDYDLSVRAQVASGAAIIVAGRLRASDTLQPIISATANLAYRTLLNTGFSAENIDYLNSDLSQPGVDGLPSRDNVRSAIEDWARTRVGLGTPLWVYLANHGNVDRFHNDIDQVVTAADLNLWLSNIEAATGVDQINLVIDACHSGSFIDTQLWDSAGSEEVSGHGRVVVASTTTPWFAYAPAIRLGQPAPVMYFSDGFWRGLGTGQDVWTAFLSGRATVEAAAQLCGDYDYTCQRPWLDDDGDAWFDAGDGLAAQARGLAVTFAGPAPYIDWVDVGWIVDGRATVRAQVRDDVGVSRVWIRVYAPSFAPPQSSDGSLITIQVPELEMNTGGADVYEMTYHGFVEDGAYQVVVYAVDADGNAAMPRWVRTGGSMKVYLPLVLHQE